MVNTSRSVVARRRRAAWRRIVATLLIAGLMFGGPAYTWAQTRDIADVPEGHWAYEAVADLVAKGYVSTFDDGTFRGDQPVDRYTFAAAVHQVLRQVETGVGRVDEADVDLLRRLATEFRDELVAFYRLRDDLLESVEGSEKTIAVFDETLNNVIASIVVLEEEQALLRRDIESEHGALRKGMEEDRTELREEIARESEALRRALSGETRAWRDALEEEARALWEALEQERQHREMLRGELASDVGAEQAELRGELLDVIAGLRARAAELDERLTELERDSAEAWEDTLWLSERVEDVYEQMDGLEERIGGLESRAGVESAQLGTARADITRLRASLEALEDALDDQAGVTDERLRELKGALEQQRADLGARLAALQEELEERLDGDLADVKDRLAETEAALFLLDARVAEEGDQTRDALRTLMEETDLLLETSEALIDDVEYLYGQLGDARHRLTALEDRVGFSDEELAQLTDRVRDELASQLNLSLMREQRIQKELDDLREEFEGYRAEKDQEVKSLRGTTSIAIAVGVIGVLVGLLSK